MRFTRLKYLLLACGLAAALAPAAATAAPRMLVGFQDDPTFRWRPYRQLMLDRALEANARILKTTVYWYAVAPKRPANPANPYSKGYYWDDVDDFVRTAERRGFEVLISIWGTPGWANAKAGSNRLPAKLSELTAFARALATRYSGRRAGFPYVGKYAVWNESNLEQFLAPQYDAKGRDVGPALYAKLYAAAYRGLKAGNPAAKVAIGETSARGRDRYVKGLKTQQTHSPGRFAQLVAKANPRLRFDAWSHHPYPTAPNLAPTQKVRWPNVTLTQLPRFESSLDSWFKRKNVPIWITEYGHESKPDEPRGVSRGLQARYLKQALGIAQDDPRVQMFIWFIFRDDPTSPWQSGLLTRAGKAKPALRAFRDVAGDINAWNPVVGVKKPGPRSRVPVTLNALEFLDRSGVGQPVAVNWQLTQEGTTILPDQKTFTPLRRDGTIRFTLTVPTRKGEQYEIQLAAFDVKGNRIDRRVTLDAR